MSEEISPQEQRGRVIYLLLGPAARLASSFDIPLAQMKRWVETAYYHELKRRGLSMREAMETMGVSLSKVTLLSRQLKRNFAAAEADYELPRRIEYSLWAAPLTAAKIAQHLGTVNREEVDEALDLLVEEGRATRKPRAGGDLFALVKGKARREWNTWLGRLDGLGNAMGSVTDAVASRFFHDDAPAFARTVTFHIRKRDLERLERFYEDELFKMIVELDSETEGVDDDEIETLALSLFWARKNIAQKTRKEGEEP